MGPRKPGVSRRQVLQGGGAKSEFDSSYQAFAKAGGGEALLFVIAGAIAAYGGSQRSGLFDELAALDAGERNSKGAAAEHQPTASCAPSKVAGKVEVVVSVPPASGPNDVRYIWLKDADSGAVVAGNKFKPEDQSEARRPSLTVVLPSGLRVAPMTSGAQYGLWEGAAVTTAR